MSYINLFSFYITSNVLGTEMKDRVWEWEQTWEKFREEQIGEKNNHNRYWDYL